MSTVRRLDPNALRIVLITDGLADEERIVHVVREAVAAGVRCVQLREPKWSARLLLRAAERLVPLLDDARGLLLVNDRVDVAATGAAHGAQIGHRSLPPQLARRVAGERAVLGYSAHDRDELDTAHAGGCDFALLSPVWPTSSKPGLPHLTVPRAAQLTEAAALPVVWLGGVAEDTLAATPDLPPAARPHGFGVRSAIMSADDPAAAAAALLAAAARLLR